jgi:hypothetical protein
MLLTLVQFALLCAENREPVVVLFPVGQVLAITHKCSEHGRRNN